MIRRSKQSLLVMTLPLTKVNTNEAGVDSFIFFERAAKTNKCIDAAFNDLKNMLCEDLNEEDQARVSLF